MLKLKSQKGFTIVELLIVIVVIGILAALVLNTFAGVQKRARDTQRQTDLNSLATQLEVYYNDRGSYPTLADIQSSTWLTANLKGLDAGAVSAPGQSSNSIVNIATPSATSPSLIQYGYVTTPATCQSPSDNTGAAVTPTTPCTKFTLYWAKEDLKSGESNPQTKSSLN